MIAVHFNEGLAARFERFAADLAEPQKTQRRARLQRFLQTGFPDTRVEEWRYTDLSGLGSQQFAPASPALSDAELRDLLLPDFDHLVYVNGRLDATLSDAAVLHGLAQDTGVETDGLQALNTAFDSGGLQLHLPAGERRPRPLQVLIAGRAGGEPGMVHQHHRIELGSNAEAKVVLHFAGHGAGRLSIQNVGLSLAAGAQLTLYRVQDEVAETSDSAALLTRIDAELGRDSRLRCLAVDGGGGLVRHDFNVRLAGPGADIELEGVYRPAPGAHLDNHTTIIHAAPHCRSRENFRGIVAEKVRAVFNGKIVVLPKAQKTDSEQRVANLLLSRRAEVNAKPELEIYADDVKCAHGATVGQLDDEALHYLRSRGVDADSARALLLRAFASGPLQGVTLAPLRSQLETLLGFPPEAGEFSPE